MNDIVTTIAVVDALYAAGFDPAAIRHAVYGPCRPGTMEAMYCPECKRITAHADCTGCPDC